MATRIKAKVKPDILVWARETAGFRDRAEAARRLRVGEDRISSWEDGDDSPSISQLRKMAKLYRRPLSVFYLQEKPRGFKVVSDLRRLPGRGLRFFSPELLQEVRYAQQRRALAFDLAEDLEWAPPRFELSAALTDNPEDIGQRIRNAMKVSYAEQIRWGDADGRAPFNAWRSRIENLGVLVFQITRVSDQEASGFAIAEDRLPVIAVNRKKVPLTRRTFTLIHELAHIMLHISGVTDFEIDAARPPEDQRIEVFCNHVAAATLIPRDHLLSERVVVERGELSIAWTDGELSNLSRAYGVSREAILRRLLAFRRTTEAFYRQKRGQFNAEYAAQAERDRERDDDDFRRNMPREILSNMGRPFVSMVLGSYHQDKITLSEVSGYLGLRTRHVAKLEQDVGMA